jgi:hypothetical protein
MPRHLEVLYLTNGGSMILSKTMRDDMHRVIINRPRKPHHARGLCHEPGLPRWRGYPRDTPLLGGGRPVQLLDLHVVSPPRSRAEGVSLGTPSALRGADAPRVFVPVFSGRAHSLALQAPSREYPLAAGRVRQPSAARILSAWRKVLRLQRQVASDPDGE